MEKKEQIKGESVKVLPSNHWKIPVSDWFTVDDEQKDVLSDMLTEKANERSVSAVTANSVARRHLLQYLRGKYLIKSEVGNNPGHKLRTCSVLRTRPYVNHRTNQEKSPFSLVRLAALVQYMTGTTICKEPTNPA